MGHSPRFVAVLAILAGAGLVSPALADSRIFTAKADRPGVTIEKATRNGQELAVVGRGDGTTLFRIDSPSTPVGCANRIAFVTSTGQKVDQVADMCALNWSVTVKVDRSTAATPAAPKPAVPAVPKPAVPAVPKPPKATAKPVEKPADDTGPITFSQEVTVSADDPTATILTVKLDGKPVRISSRKGRSVVFEVNGTAEGIVCDRSLGLVLSNGREITRKTNICLNDWVIVIATAGKDDDIVVVEPPRLPGLPRPPIPPAPNPGMAWTFSGFGDSASLIYGIPQTDASAFVAECTAQSGAIKVTLLDGGPAILKPGDRLPITFAAGAFSQTYPGVGSPVSQLAGVSLPQVEIAAGDPLWTAMIRETSLDVSVGTSGGTLLSLAGSAAPTRKFLGACSKPAILRPVATPQGPAGNRGGGGGIVVGNFFCANGSSMTINFRGADQTAVVFEPGAPPLTLYWVADGGPPRYAVGEARLVLRDESEIRWARYGGRAQSCFAR